MNLKLLGPLTPLRNCNIFGHSPEKKWPDFGKNNFACNYRGCMVYLCTSPPPSCPQADFSIPGLDIIQSLSLGQPSPSQTPVFPLSICNSLCYGNGGLWRANHQTYKTRNTPKTDYSIAPVSPAGIKMKHSVINM